MSASNIAQALFNLGSNDSVCMEISQIFISNFKAEENAMFFTQPQLDAIRSLALLLSGTQ